MHFTEKEKQERLNRERINHLAFALRKRERLEQELREIDAYIATEARQYWKYRGYTAMPRIEKLRLAILGK